MMIKINKDFMTPEEKNNMYENGYRYMVEGDYRIVGGFDTWTGMPNVTNNIYVFTDKDEAEAFAKKQIWVFNHEVHAKVEAIPAHTKTRDEIYKKK